MTGRPSLYTPELAATICERLAAGESLRAICRDEGMPSEVTVRRWYIDDTGGFSAHYAKARDAALDKMAEEILEIADEQVGSTESGATDSGAIARNRLRFDARRWYLSKLAPKRYGDRLELAGDKDAPLTVQVVRLGGEQK